VTGTSGFFTTMAWDSSNHLYALNGKSGRLHVYTVTSTAVVEAPGSPYDLPFCGFDSEDGVEGCAQTLIVRAIP
jgi:outer membrane protein assembly factor BamB